MTTEAIQRIDPETGLPWPKCPKPGCIFDVAAGKDGKPLKWCDTHRDKRPSAAARKAETPFDVAAAPTTADAIVAAEDNLAASSFGKPSPAPKPSAKPSKRERDNAAIAARLAAKPAPKAKAGSVADFPVLAGRAADAGLAKPILGTETPDKPIVARWHKSSGKFLAIAKLNGKPIYRYGATAAEAEDKMRAALAG